MPRRTFSVSEVSGRLLHEQLLAGCQDWVAGLDCTTQTVNAPEFPEHGTTDTGTMRAVHVAS